MAKRKKTNTIQKVGSWAFIIGVLIAIIAGFFPLSPVLTSILIVLGLIVGFLNITGTETNQFLFAALVLVVVAGVGGGLLSQIQTIGEVLKTIFAGMMTFVVPATIVVAL